MTIVVRPAQVLLECLVVGELMRLRGEIVCGVGSRERERPRHIDGIDFNVFGFFLPLVGGI